MGQVPRYKVCPAVEVIIKFQTKVYYKVNFMFRSKTIFKKQKHYKHCTV
jgi:hypothetical protein